MSREIQTCPHRQNRTVPMVDGTCPSCRKKVDEPRKTDLGFLAGRVAENVDPGPQPVATWKPVVSAILVYMTIIMLAALTGNLEATAEACVGAGAISFFAAKLWLFAVIARGSVFAALCCVCVPLLWIFFVSEHWMAARWPVCLGIMGVVSVPVSHYILEVGKAMGT